MGSSHKSVEGCYMVDKRLVTFIKEARKRGFDDYDIRKPLLGEGWSSEDIEEAFHYLKHKRSTNQISIHLDDEVLAVVEKRAKRNMLSVSEQVEDIIRRSAVNAKRAGPKPEKLDDLLVGLFSRRTRKTSKI